MRPDWPLLTTTNGKKIPQLDNLHQPTDIMDVTPFRLRQVSKAGAIPPRALDGGVRVFMSMKNLKSLGLDIGDYVLLQQPDHSPKAVGVAWNLKADSKDQARVACIEEPIRDLFGLKMEEKVTISKFEPQRLQHAHKIVVQELEPGSSVLPREALEFWAKVALCKQSIDFASLLLVATSTPRGVAF